VSGSESREPLSNNTNTSYWQKIPKKSGRTLNEKFFFQAIEG
jgi:hypothetical protein